MVSWHWFDQVPDVKYKNSNSNNIKYMRGEVGGSSGKLSGRTLLEKILVVLCVVLILIVLILAILYGIAKQEGQLPDLFSVFDPYDVAYVLSLYKCGKDH